MVRASSRRGRARARARNSSESYTVVVARDGFGLFNTVGTARLNAAVEATTREEEASERRETRTGGECVGAAREEARRIGGRVAEGEDGRRDGAASGLMVEPVMWF